MKNRFTLIIILFALLTAVSAQQVDKDKVIVEEATDATG